MIDYRWADWLVALSTTIAENDERYLAERARAVNWRKDEDRVPLLAYGDENIDPMSFLYFLAQKNTTHQFDDIFQSVNEVFGIGLELPEFPAFIPTPTPNTKTLFHNGKSFRPDLLWRLFRQAAPIHERPAIQPDDFDAVLELPNVGVPKLTQTLFIVNPRHYLPADGSAGRALPHLSELEGNVQNCKDYLHRMEALRRLFPGCDPYEINVFLDTQSKEPLISKQTRFFQVSTRVYYDKTDYWGQTGEQKEKLPFNEGHYVYTGGGGNKRKYPLKKPKRGDVILVRFSTKEGRAIGVVEENGYAPSGWHKDSVIHVHWVNKTSAHLCDMGQQTLMIGFSGAKEYRSAFRNTDAYKVSFDWIGRLTGNIELQTDSDAQTGSPTPSNSTGEPNTSFPLNPIVSIK